MRIFAAIAFLFSLLFSSATSAHEEDIVTKLDETLALLQAIVAPAEPEKPAPSVDTCEFTFATHVDTDTVTDLLSKVGPCLKAGFETTVLINSGGGDVAAAFMFYDTIAHYGDRKKLRTIGVGDVASAAVIMFLSGGQREIGYSASILVHPGYRFWEGKLTDYDQHEINITSKSADAIYYQIVAKETNRDIDELASLIKKGTVFLADLAVGYGFAHKILGD